MALATLNLTNQTFERPNFRAFWIFATFRCFIQNDQFKTKDRPFKCDSYNILPTRVNDNRAVSCLPQIERRVPVVNMSLCVDPLASVVKVGSIVRKRESRDNVSMSWQAEREGHTPRSF
ncbi:hypothetical protein NPIL_411521 [Nephila pilipes]|uniref:Uncharacterized protein n=1 Tax=Nephila pilipes TaxID=299642 RepID=A0A8X6IL52_NEPPI|nr:hypothetical protein NPIL_411521 [Nephila pilipes]